MKRKAFSPHDDIYIQYLRNMEKHDMPVQHYHDGYEIFLMLGGKRYLFYDNICFTLERGDMAVLRPFDIHYAQSRDAEYYERFVLNFSETALSTLLSREELRLLREKLVPCVVHLNEEQTELMLDFFKRVNGYFEKRFPFGEASAYGPDPADYVCGGMYTGGADCGRKADSGADQDGDYLHKSALWGESGGWRR